jgi:long-subunit fatty acid transport protein
MLPAQPMFSLGATVLPMALLAGAAVPTHNAPSPSPSPTSIVDQDELDLTNQSNIVLGVGARALGMGGAFLARADDATAASWNPAGLSYLRRPEVSLVGNYLTAHSTLGLDYTTGNASTLDFLAVTYPLSFGGSAGSAQVSYQRAIPFNLSRETTTPDVTRTYDSTGGFDVIAFGLGWKLTRTLRVGGTLNRWTNGYEQSFERTPRRRVSRLDKFDLDAWNVNLGIIWTPIEQLNLGVVGKTPFTADVVLDRYRKDSVSQEDGEPDIVTENAYSSSDVRLEFPGAWGVGASWRPRSTFTAAADYTRTYWSSARIRNYFTLLPLEPGGTPGPTNTFDSLVWPNVDADSQADSIQIRLGIEYVLIRSRVKVPLRAGYVNDQQYTKDFQGDAPRFNAVTAGTGLILGSMLFDVAYQYQWGSYRAVDKLTPGGIAATSHTHRFYASLIYRWGGIR